MSEEKPVEGAEAPEDDGFGAAFAEFVKEEGQAAGTPDADEPKADEAGQVDEGSTPTGQAATTDTPSGDAGKTPPASKVSTDDLWKDAAPELRAAHEAAVEAERKRADAAENVVKVHAGRLTQAYRERDALQARVTEGTKAPPKEGGESEVDYRKRMTEEFPDFAPLFDKLDTANEKIASLETAQTNQASAQTEEALQEQQAILEQAHPTYQDDVTHPDDKGKPFENRRPNPAFLEWVVNQPGYVQEALRANGKTVVDGQSAADILTRYKAETAPAEDPAKKREEERRKEQLEASRKADLRTPAGRSASDGSFEQEFNRFVNEDKRTAARR